MSPSFSLGSTRAFREKEATHFTAPSVGGGISGDEVLFNLNPLYRRGRGLWRKGLTERRRFSRPLRAGRCFNECETLMTRFRQSILIVIIIAISILAVPIHSFPAITVALAQGGSSLSLRNESWSAITDDGDVQLSSDATSLFFDFPVSTGNQGFSDRTINGLMTNYVGSLADATYLTATFKVVATGTPKFNYMFESGNTCANPAHARLLFARTGWSKGGEFYRWWANSNAYKLAPGGAALTVPLIPNQWSSVFGKLGSHDAASLDGFRSALKNVGQVGLVFGGGCFFGHGVSVSGGSAKFIMTNYGIQ
jgi:hypothetical protein